MTKTCAWLIGLQALLVAPRAFAQGLSSDAPPPDTSPPELPEPETPPPETPPSEAEAPPSKGNSGHNPDRIPVASIAAGGALQRALDIPVAGVEATGEIGNRLVCAATTFLDGRTPGNLAVFRVTGGLVIGARVSSWSFGVGPYFGYLWIPRHTASTSLAGGTIGLSARVGWDFYQGEKSALFVQARFTGETGALPILGASLSVGFRFSP